MSDDYEDEEISYSLTDEGAVDVVRWILAAWDSGHFDWDLIVLDEGETSLAERWRLVHWLNEMSFGLDVAGDANDREINMAVMLTFFITGVRAKSESFGMRPTDFIEATIIASESMKA